LVAQSNGALVFTSPLPLPVADQDADGLAVGDFNRDGRPDLAVIDATANTVTILLGLGNSAFIVPNSFPTGNNPVSVMVADVNGDGLPDVVTTNLGSDNVSVLLNLSIGGGAFSPA